MDNATTLKLIFLFVAVWFTIINVGKIAYGNKVSAINFFIQSVAITGFVYMQWMM